MGPNGSGKSTLAHALMGRPGTEVTEGSITMDGQELTALPAWQRARAGLFLALQHPVEVPGVGLHSLLDRGGARRRHATPVLTERMVDEAKAVGLDPSSSAARSTSTSRGASGSATRWCSSASSAPPSPSSTRSTRGSTSTRSARWRGGCSTPPTEWGLGILAITHFNRFLVQLEADLVHVMVDGRIVATGDADLALQLEQTGYVGYQDAR